MLDFFESITFMRLINSITTHRDLSPHEDTTRSGGGGRREPPAPPADRDTAVAGPLAPDDARVTPMMAQYLEIKAANPDCLLFYRMGDFYELFFDDAEIASRALGIVLTKRGKHAGADIPMCGVPVERADDYLQRLIAPRPSRRRLRADRGSRRGEEARRQIGRAPRRGARSSRRAPSPRTTCSIRRAPTSSSPWRAGASRTSASRLRARRHRHLDRALPRQRDRRGRPRRRDRPARAARDRPAGRGPRRSGARRICGARARAAVTPLARDGLDPASAERRLKEFFGVATLDAFGTFSRAEIAAAGSALALRRAHPVRRAGRRCRRRAAETAGATLADRRRDPRQSRDSPARSRASAPAACSPPSTAR